VLSRNIVIGNNFCWFGRSLFMFAGFARGRKRQGSRCSMACWASAADGKSQAEREKDRLENNLMVRTQYLGAACVQFPQMGPLILALN